MTNSPTPKHARGSRNHRGSHKKNVTGVVTTTQGANRQQLRASLNHKPNATRNHHSKNRPRVGDAPHGKGTRAFDPQKWVEKQRDAARDDVEIGRAA
jgi:LysM repeat protein